MSDKFKFLGGLQLAATAITKALEARKSNGHFLIPYGALRDQLADALHRLTP